MRRYEVVKKKTKFDDAMGEMEERICRQFCHHGRSQCGIVYCLSRNDCEKVAAELQQRLAARLGHRTRVRCPHARNQSDQKRNSLRECTGCMQPLQSIVQAE